MITENHSFRLSAAIILAMVLGSYVFASHANASAPEGISRINGGIDIDIDELVGDVSTINGRINIARGATAEDVETINGGIDVGSNARIRSAETVNGSITLDSNVVVRDSLSSVNGGVRTRAGTEIGDEIHTVNGKIDLRSTRVGGDVHTSNGDIELRDGSVVSGDVIVRGKLSWFSKLFSFGHHRPSDLRVDADSVIEGDIHLYREVNLRIHEDARVGEIIRHY